MITYIGIILFILGILFLATIVLLADEKGFFRYIAVNTFILIGYLYVGEKYALYFSKEDLFGKGKLFFLLGCLSFQVIINFIWVIVRRRKRIRLEQQKAAFKKTEEFSE